MSNHDNCDKFPCKECIAELNICPGCGDYRYDADPKSPCESCEELISLLF